MKTQLAKSVLQLFHEEFDGHLPAYSRQEWERHYFWLDASGMAIYLLDRLRSFGLTGRLPDEVHWRLASNCTDNRARTQRLFEEFVLINNRFAELGLRHINLKGFTLLPVAVQDPSLRFQDDLDFMIPRCEVLRVKEALENFGYHLYHAGASVWEFKTGTGTVTALKDRYRQHAQRSIDIHLLSPDSSADSSLLDRVQMQHWNGYAFPALSETDKFIALAEHLFRHMRGEWTRLSWVVEFKRLLIARRDDASFWQGIRYAVSRLPRAATAIGASILIADTVLGDCIPPEMSRWVDSRVPSPVRIWIERYSEAVLLSDFPGTKLYLLLEEAIAEDGPELRDFRRKKLLPLHSAARIVHGVPAKDSLRLRIGRMHLQLRFTVFRLRFHLVQGVRYLREAQRWKRIAALPQG